MDILKDGWPFPDLKKTHFLFKIRSMFIVPIVGTFSRIILGWCNNLQVHNRETLRKLIRSEKRKAPLITVSNHTSCIDDPSIWASLRWRDLWSSHTMRWSLAAHDICFTNRIYNWFFSSGKCVPIVRGNGVYQKGMDFCVDRLNEGSWVHIFPEGKVNLTLEVMRLKWGVGRLIYDCKIPPVVLPFYHMGMETVLPNQTPYIPQIGKNVTVLVGEPIDFKSQLETLRAGGARSCYS
ncbi:Tafazzin [Armadillidium nasatum]|uniref:Tafazzin family protein n=1 Tax=Armadillidium nasatum TaxID=96803 RepID=A0A5N5SQ63_9CRUS|nr:Tafazzin [Armadillidium nasatum]